MCISIPRFPAGENVGVIVVVDFVVLHKSIVRCGTTDAQISVGANLISDDFDGVAEDKSYPSCMIQADNAVAYCPSTSVGAVYGSLLRRTRILFDSQGGDRHIRDTSMNREGRRAYFDYGIAGVVAEIDTLRGNIPKPVARFHFLESGNSPERNVIPIETAGVAAADRIGCSVRI